MLSRDAKNKLSTACQPIDPQLTNTSSRVDIIDLCMQECSNMNTPISEQAQKRTLNYK